MTDKILLSTVTPVYRGSHHLDELAGELQRLRQKLEESTLPLELAEAIFVDDSSRDGSAKVLARLDAHHDWVRVITLSRNFGQHPATVVGVLHSSGDWVATLDEDLQHLPAHLMDLLRKAVADEHDLVYAKPEGNVHPGRLRDFASRSFKRFAGWATKRPEVVNFNSFRMMRGSVARAAAAVSRHETYFDVALCWFTDRVGCVQFPLRDRRQADDEPSGYRLTSLLSHARRLMISSEVRLLRLASAIGLAAMVAGTLGGAAIVVYNMLWPGTIPVRGWASLMVSVLFFGGLISLLLGIALEYLSHLYLHVLGRPAYFVVDRSMDELLAPLIDDDPFGA